MFDYNTIITEGSDLVGWRQSADSTKVTVSSDLLVSTSGLYVNDLPGVNFDIIDESVSDDNTSVNTYLTNVQKSELGSLMYEFTSKSKEILGSRGILNNFDVTNGVADYTNLSTKNARFVGWVITPKRSSSIKALISKIGLQISTSETVRIFLYETSQQDAIATFDFVASSPLSLQWKVVTDFIVSHRSDYGSNQSYLLGYYEHDPNNDQTWQLKGQAVKFEFDCGCNDSPKRHFGRFLDIQPIMIENEYLNGILLPSMNDITSFYTDVSYGLYAKLNVTCDITDVLVDNLTEFARAYQYKIAIRVLDDYLASVRINPTTDRQGLVEMRRKARDKYWGILNGWVDAGGFKHRGLVEELSIDFSGIDRVCLPCDTREAFIGYKGRPQ